ncbi:MAG: antitoxin VapB family protein [Spirochaetales bacterium]|nr:antitoxin VapB family protein [Spirochaetales bacterium]
MAVKTITIDMEAYDALARQKRPGESFSQVIKRTLKEERYTAAHLLGHLDSVLLSEAALDATDAVVASRDEDMVAEPGEDYGS